MTFDRAALDALPIAPGSTGAIRERAFAQFEALPLPSQETEEWRYTDLSEFDLDFAAHVPGHGEGAPEPRVQGLAASLLQHNSSVVMTTSGQDLEATGVIFCDLDLAAEKYPDLVGKHLHALVPTDRTLFTALHGAFRTGGTFLYVPPDVAVEMPLQTLTYLDADGAAVFPHTLLIADRGAEVTFIDRYVSPDLGRGLSDAIAEIVVGDGAHVQYASIQEWGTGVTHLAVQRARLGRDADFRSLAVGFGASLARAEAETVLAEPGGFSEMLGVFFADETQHFDHRSVQDHAAANCTSDLLYKGALRDHSRAVYSGWVHVRPGAQKTNAMQTSRNMVLSESAKADAIPNLEIEANDVRCGHAASVGPVEEETLFYLQSRGIPRDEAERLVVTGFFQEVLDRVALEEVRTGAELAIQEELAKAI
ncbi:MAG TPA: Fe-S cluster assembly protein SufD [Actinomycetota bacterium]|jgi:Fe-S cluster assembly protein SufD|nr:Fe-S cluster assembly protein SufD [Actinomycetota bacterium]